MQMTLGTLDWSVVTRTGGGMTSDRVPVDIDIEVRSRPKTTANQPAALADNMNCTATNMSVAMSSSFAALLSLRRLGSPRRLVALTTNHRSVPSPTMHR